MKPKRVTLVLMLTGLAVVGPLVAYAGITVIYPKSTHTVNVNTTPPITFTQGSDYAAASANGFASSFVRHDNDASFVITLSGLSGGNITIDNYTMATKIAAVTSYNLTIADALSGTLAPLTSLKVRLWTGAVAPTTDNSAGICGVLSLQSGAGIGSSRGPCTGAFVRFQVVYELGTDATGTSTVAVRPSNIVFA